MTDRLLIRAIQWFAAAGCAALVAAPALDHWLHRVDAASAGQSIGDEFVAPAHAAPRPVAVRSAGDAHAAPGPVAAISGSPAIASLAAPGPQPRPAPRPAAPGATAPVHIARSAVVQPRAAAPMAAPAPVPPRAVSASSPALAGGAPVEALRRAVRTTPGGAVPVVIAPGAALTPWNQAPDRGRTASPAEPAPAGTPEPGAPSGGQQSTHDSADTQAPPARLTLMPARAAVAPGEVVVVKVNLSDALGVSSVPFHLKFDPAQLEYLGARTGPAFNGTSLQPILMVAENPDRPGDVAFGLVLAGASSTYSGSGDLAILEFRALQAGPSDLRIEDASIRGPISEPLVVESRDARVEVR